MELGLSDPVAVLIFEEMGESAGSSLGMEAALTLQIQPYRRRVVVGAHRFDA